jgi:hypothetical protein
MSWEQLEVATASGSGGFEDGIILPVGRFPAAIVSAEFQRNENKFRKKPEDPEFVEQLVVLFKTLKPFTAQDVENYGLENEDVGLYGYITAWINKAVYNLVAPEKGSVSGITVFLDDLFGRKLTADEAAVFSVLALRDRLEGLQGWVSVGRSSTGKSKFNGFKLPKGKSLDPAQFIGEPIRQLHQQVSKNRGLREDSGFQEGPDPEDRSAKAKAKAGEEYDPFEGE